MSELEGLDRAIERLLADESPRFEAAGLDAEEQRMLRMAQLLRGSQPLLDTGSPANSPSRAFREDLHDRLFPAALPQRVSRRTAFLSGLGALAAGVVGGLGLDRLLTSGSGTNEAMPLVEKGAWFHVADVADVPPGAVHPFTAGAVQGFLMNRGGELHALSRICTHMGCALRFTAQQQSFQCPCHGAAFDLRGRQQYTPHGYNEELPSLPAIDVRVEGQSIQVRGA